MRSRRVVCLWAAVLVVGLAAGDRAFGESARDLVRRGNAELAAGRYDQALVAYDKASVDEPESPRISFNKGNVFYRKGDYAKARELFEEAALKARDLRLEAKCKYNLGNCLFREGRRQADSDLQKALAAFQKSVRHYQDALQLDPGIRDAAHNIEVARLTMKDILDKLQKQQQQAKQRQQEQKEAMEKLNKLIERQQKALDGNKDLARQQADKRQPQEWQGQVDSLGRDQQAIREDTKALSKKLADPQKAATQPSASPAEQARQHLDRAATQQAVAGEQLRKRMLDGARPSQQDALRELEKARDALAGKGGQGRQPESRPQPQSRPADSKQAQAPQQDKTARDILDEEKQNRRRRSLQMSGGHRPVDKDW